jgi:hypothetical protein
MQSQTTIRICSIEGCDRPLGPHGGISLGYCPMHYGRWRYTGSPAPYVYKPRLCSIPDCGRKHKNYGYCRMHAYRFWKNGDPLVVRQAKHGLSKRPEVTVWRGMVSRCTNQNATDYPRYGGRGIMVCDRWRLFANFFADMGERPSPKHSIDRIDNDGNYEPDNCRWATASEQRLNQRPRSSRRSPAR